MLLKLSGANKITSRFGKLGIWFVGATELTPGPSLGKRGELFSPFSL
jgi:hypothetical protein